MRRFLNRFGLLATVGIVALLAVGSWFMFVPSGNQGELAAAGALDIGSASDANVAPAPQNLRHYIEIMDSCNFAFEGDCVVARSGPATSSPVVAHLRKGIVLEVATSTVDADGHAWYRILFTEWLRYPDRVSGEWYVAGDYVHPFDEAPQEELAPGRPASPTERRIVVKRKEEMLYAYDGGTLFLKTPVSTGLDLTPTPRGDFVVYKKTPTRYMQGPISDLSDQYYDLPGVPWDLYFTAEGGAIHGAYWHNSFGQEWSHGCINVPLDIARVLYNWAPVGTEVLVID